MHTHTCSYQTLVQELLSASLLPANRTVTAER